MRTHRPALAFAIASVVLSTAGAVRAASGPPIAVDSLRRTIMTSRPVASRLVTQCYESELPAHAIAESQECGLAIAQDPLKNMALVGIEPYLRVGAILPEPNVPDARAALTLIYTHLTQAPGTYAKIAPHLQHLGRVPFWGAYYRIHQNVKGSVCDVLDNGVVSCTATKRRDVIFELAYFDAPSNRYRFRGHAFSSFGIICKIAAGPNALGHAQRCNEFLRLVPAALNARPAARAV